MLTVSFMKMHCRKLPTKVIHYRKYQKFSDGSVLNSLKDVFSNRNPNEENGRIDFFLSTCSKVLKKYAPSKKCTYKAIGQFLRRNVSKEITKRSKLRNKFLKTRYDIDMFNYNFMCSLYEKKQQQKNKNYFANLHIKDVTGNKKTWKTTKSCFSDQSKISEKIFLIQNSQK